MMYEEVGLGIEEEILDKAEDFNDYAVIVEYKDFVRYIDTMNMKVSDDVDEFYIDSDRNVETENPNLIPTNGFPRIDKQKLIDEIRAEGKVKITYTIEFKDISYKDFEKLEQIKSGDSDLDYEDILDEYDYDYITSYEYIELPTTHDIDKMVKEIEELVEMEDELEISVNEAKSTNSVYINIYEIENEDNNITIRISDHSPNIDSEKADYYLYSKSFKNRDSFTDMMSERPSDMEDIKMAINDLLE